MMVKEVIPVLSITGSDGSGRSGIQSDVKTISDLGGYALTAVTSVTARDEAGQQQVLNLPIDWVCAQVRSVVSREHPQVVKLGLVGDARLARALRDEVIGCRQVVFVPGIHTADGHRLVDDAVVRSLLKYLVPIATVLMMRCADVEIVTQRPITSDEDMLVAARELCSHGAQWVLLRGGRQLVGRLTALLYSDQYHQFFSSYNTTGWQQHGVSSALSSAIATRLAMGDDVPTAVAQAHDYMHSQVVYAVQGATLALRPADLYYRLMSLIVAHYREEHAVSFYADKLAISTRYLSTVTRRMVDKTPKQVIDEHLCAEARRMLDTTRLTTKEVADGLGFPSSVAFCKFFRHYEGCSPLAYRKRQ